MCVAIVVASGQSVYVYKNMRPFYKYTLEGLPVSEVEQQYWNLTRDVRHSTNTVSIDLPAAMFITMIQLFYTPYTL